MIVAMALVCGILSLIGRWYPMPRPAFVLALIATMQGALQVNDSSASARAITRICAALSAFAAIVAITAVHGSLEQINVVLVMIAFAASYAARFGVRWRGVGIFTFMCAVVASYLREDERDLWTVASALLISGVVVHLVRNVVVLDRPALEFRRLVSAALSVSQKLRKLVDAVGRAEPRASDLRLVMTALSAEIRACESALPLENPGLDDSETTIALRLLDLQVAAETLIHEASRQQAENRQARPRTDAAISEVLKAETALQAGLAALPASFPSSVGNDTPVTKADWFPKRGEWLRDQTLRRALQVTLACAIAALLGEAISSERWFWAVISAFMIFNNAQSGAAVAVRGFDRAWGTAIGIVIGIILATLTHNHLLWLSAALAISVFITFFVARVSYVAMSLFLTISLSLIYGLIGIFTPELLVLRLQETAIGVGSGALVALLLFPISLHQQIAKAINALLIALADLLEAISDVGKQDRGRSLARNAAAVDRNVGAVLTTIGPLRSTWSVGNMMTAGRDVLREAYVMAYAAHQLERTFRTKEPNEQQRGALLALSRRLRTTAANGSTSGHPVPDPADTASAQTLEKNGQAGSSAVILSRILDVIERERRSG